MRQNNDLFDLIRSLSKSEKRRFKMHCAIQEGEKQYSTLFDEIEKLKEYDEKKLRSRLSGHSVSRHWAFNKKYLYDKVLQSLRGTSLKEDPDSEVGDLLESYKVLKEKGLTSQADNHLRRAKKKAREKDLFMRLFAIINLEYFDRLYSPRKAVDPNIESIIAERDRVLAIIQNYSYIADVFSKVGLSLRLGGGIKSRAEQRRLLSIVRPLLSLKQEDLLSDTAIVFFNMAIGEYHYATGESRKGLYFLHDNLGDATAGPVAKPELLISELSMYISLAVRSRDVEGLDRELNKLHAFIDRPPYAYNYVVFERWFYYSIASQCICGNFREACRFIERGLDVFRQKEQGISKWGRMSCYYTIAYAWFGSGDLTKSMPWVQKILNSDETDLETYTLAMLLQLATLYEKNNLDLLEYQYRSFARHLKSKKRADVARLGLADLFRKLCSGEEGALQKFRQRLERFSQDPALKNVEIHFDLTAWVDSLIDGRAFSEHVAKRHERSS